MSKHETMSTIQMLRLYQTNMKKDISISSDVIKEAEEKMKNFDLKFKSLKDTTRNLSVEFDKMDSKCKYLDKQFHAKSASRPLRSEQSQPSTSLSSSPESKVQGSSCNNEDDSYTKISNCSSSSKSSPILSSDSSTNSHSSLDSSNSIIVESESDDLECNDDENDESIEHYEPSSVYIDRSVDDCNQMIKLMLLESRRIDNNQITTDENNVSAPA